MDPLASLVLRVFPVHMESREKLEIMESEVLQALLVSLGSKDPLGQRGVMEFQVLLVLRVPRERKVNQASQEYQGHQEKMGST